MLSWDKTPAISSMRCTRAWVEIDLEALADNVRSLKSLLAPGTDLMSVVKADAYGHGAVTVARVALCSGATWLGVATVPEGIELRQAGISAPILVMGAVNDPVEVRAIARWQLQPTIVNPKQALVFSETLATSGQTTPLPVHLKIDTGMSRLGFRWQKAVEFAQLVQQLPYLKIVSLYSHLATADSPDTTVMQQQHKRFAQAIADLTQAGLCPPRLHLANSAATIAKSALHYDMVRVGLATYGLYPAPHLQPAQKHSLAEKPPEEHTVGSQQSISLKPVLSVKAKITHIKNLLPGDGVSYSHKFVATQPMRIAIVGIGYADGVPRLLSNRLEVLLKGQRVKQLGAITMDQLMLDISTVDDVQENDVVTLLGTSHASACRADSLSADNWANLTDTISWEILCGFKHRLPRITLSSPQPSIVNERGDAVRVLTEPS